MTMTVVLDANVLYPQHICDLFLNFADAKLIRPVWSDWIHDEWMRNVLKSKPQLDPAKIERRKQMMDRAFPDALVHEFEVLVDTIEGVHKKDRHVMAVAIRARADSIVTFNMKDFSAAAQSQYGISVIHPDQLMLKLIRMNESMVIDTIRIVRRHLKNPPISAEHLLAIYERSGLHRSVAVLTPFLDRF